jgi:glyoxylase-like metal-dependent hydrolase (beta-lactamase superfamily II)
VVIETFPVGPLGCNCSLIVDPVSKTAVVIDPGGHFETIRSRIEKAGAKVTAILHTHAHVDHVGATSPLQRLSGAPARIHQADRFLYDMLPVQSAFVGIQVPVTCDIEGDLIHDGTVSVGALELAVIHTPGHTPGSVCFFLKAGDDAVVFTGDTLFRRGIGRTDLWGGDGPTIQRSLRTRLLSLEDATRVIPGHGPRTTIGEERKENPFLGGAPAM